MAVRQPMPFAALLKRYRTTAGLTQEALAERATLSVRAISDLERGINRAPQRATVDLLVSALELTADAREELEHSIQRQRGAYRTAGDVEPPAPHRLPETLTPLVGRERDVADLVHRLRWGRARLLTITGPGGVGKTRVGIAVARTVQHDAADGLLYVPLASLRSADLVAASLARALDLTEESGRPLEDLLINTLHSRQMVLLLDNFEHLTQASRLLSRVLHQCPRTTLLVTSRTALRIGGEQRFELQPLEVPSEEKLASLGVAARYPAVELFVQRAQAVKRDFALNEANLHSVVEICSRLDGLPLAIELAAARVSALMPQELLMRLDQRLRVLTDGATDLPDRHQTMANAIAWSYHLLDPRAQALFRRFSIFAGSWSLEAAESVAAPGEGDATDVLAQLSALVHSSIIQVRDGSDGDSRYTMLETVREYALERLEARGEVEDARMAHLTFFLDLAERAGGELTGKDASIWLARLREEEDNLREALQSLAEGGKVRHGLQLAGALWRFWYTLGAFAEGRGWLSRFLEPETEDEGEPAVRARGLFGLGAMAYSQSDYDTALRAYEESLGLYHAANDANGIATVLNGLGVLACDTGDYTRAVRLLSECAEHRRGDLDRFGLAAALSNLANAVRYCGELQKAADLYEESLAVYGSVGSRLGADITLANLGQLVFLLGDYDEARRFAEQSLELARDLGRQYSVALALMDLGNLALELGDLESAGQRYDEALELYVEIGDRTSEGTLLANQANLARARRDYRRARELAMKSLTLQRALGDDRNIAVALLYLGDIAREQGDNHEAAAYYREALEHDLRIGFLVGVAECLEHLGWLHATQRAERGVSILAAADSLRATTGAVLTPAERANHDHAVTILQQALAEHSYAKSWRRGQSTNWRTLAADIVNGTALT